MGMKLNGLRHALLVSAAAFGFGATAAVVAQPAWAQEATRPYDIPAQNLDDALREFARQSGRDVLFTPESVANKRSGALQAAMTEREALRTLLQGTGLRFEQTGSGGYAVQDPSAPTRVGEASDAAEPEDNGTAEILVVGARTLNADIRRSENDAQPYVVFDRATIEQSGASNVEDFLRRNLSMMTNSISPTQQGSVATSEISLRGLGTDETLILVDGRRLPGVPQSNAAAPRQADINGIPLAAIERIEVLPSTASGIYGGGATGGVINIVLRRDYSGAELALTYGNTVRGDLGTRRVDFSSGGEFAGTSVLFSAAYADSETLTYADRPFYENARRHVLNTNPAAILNTPALGATTNIRSQNGSPLTLRGSNIPVGSNITHVPYGYAGVSSDAGNAFVQNAGSYNLDLSPAAETNPQGGLRPLLAAPTIAAANLSARRDIATWLDAFVDLSASQNTNEALTNYQPGLITLTATDPGNPFNQAINVTTPGMGFNAVTRSETSSYRAVAGALFDLPADWRGAVEYTWNRVEVDARTNENANRSALSAAVRSGTINIFRDTRGDDSLFSAFALPLSHAPSEETLQQISLRFSGDLPFAFPGGQPTATILVEHRSDQLGDQITTSTPSAGTERRVLTPERQQSTDSIYAELLAPIFGDFDVAEGVALELQIAVRSDNYVTETSNGSLVLAANGQPTTPIVRVRSEEDALSPTYAARFRPFSGITLRASYGEGFLPPNVLQLSPGNTSVVPASIVGLLALTDPRRGNEPITTSLNLIQTGQGGDLRAERSTSTSAGAIFEPAFLPGLRLSVDWTQIEKIDNIAPVVGFAQSAFAFESAAPGVIVRGPVAPGDTFGVGPVTGINTGLFNVAQVNVEALDFGADYHREIPWGELIVALHATRMLRLETQLTSASPLIDYTGVGSAAAFASGNATDGGVDWRANLSVGLDGGAWTLQTNLRYVGEYYLNAAHTVDVNQGAATVPSQTYVDLYGSLRLGEFFDLQGPMAPAELTFAVSNLFDTAPPLDVVGRGTGFVQQTGYSYYGDPRGAAYSIGVRYRF